MTLLYVIEEDGDDEEFVTFCDTMVMVVFMSSMRMKILLVVVDVDGVVVLVVLSLASVSFNGCN